MPSPTWNNPPRHPLLQYVSQRSSVQGRLSCSSQGVTEQSNVDTAPQAEHESSCVLLTHDSIQTHFLNEDQETHGLTPLILSLQDSAQGDKVCAVLHICKTP